MRRASAAFTCALGVLLAGRPTAGGDVPVDLEGAIPSFQVEEFQPDLRWSGRLLTIAVHPTDGRKVTVASDTGGLFQTDDGGETWRHLDGLAAWRTVAVAYYPADPQVLVATAAGDFKASSAAGIWVSRDGGDTWTKAGVGNVPSSGACTPSTAAWEISASPSGTILFVATDCGIAVTDNTRSWTRFTDGDAGRSFHSVLPLSGRNVVAAGPDGVYHSSDFGRRWTRATGPMGPVSSYHALAVSPLDASQVYIIDDRKAVRDPDSSDSENDVYDSFDGGVSWVRGPNLPPGPDGCGGVPFVRAAAVGSRTQLYAGNRCDVFRGAGASWVRMPSDHGDIHDLALVGNEPRYLATDGGFHVWDPEARNWGATGGSRSGLAALQLYEVTGQESQGSIFPWPFIEPRRYHLYIGTQDNDLWSSDDGGRAWPYAVGGEGFRIDLPRSVRTVEQSKVVFTLCSACRTLQGGANFRDRTEFRDASRAPDKPYAMLAEGAFAQYVRFGQGAGRVTGFSMTEDFGGRWRLLDFFPEDPASLPQFAGTPAAAYFAVRTGSDGLGRPVDRLVRVSGLRGESPSECDDDGFTRVARRCYPDMAGHGGLGRRDHTSGFATESVFAVDPADAMHLIAPDPRDDNVKETWDGGKSWQPIAGARALVTQDGALTSLVNPTNEWSSLVSVLSFHPENATLVLMGAREGGIYFSHDRGRSFQHVAGSERIPNISSFHWKSPNEVFVSSYGRGLWRLRIAYRSPIEAFAAACGDPCLLADVLRPEPLPFDGKLVFDTAVLAYGGGVMDARAEDGVLKSIALSPGTAWLITAPTGKTAVSSAALAGTVQAKTEAPPPITETSEPGEFEGVKAARALFDQGWLTRGFTLADGKLKHVVVAKEEAVVKGPGSLVAFKNTGKTESGVLQRPYLSAEYDPTPGLLTVIGSRFDSGQPVAVLLDGEPLHKRVLAGPDGGFTLKLRPRLGPGPHGLRAQQATEGKVGVDEGTDFLVPSADAAEKENEK